MVTHIGPTPRAPWQDAHRLNPVQDNELPNSPADVFSWCRSVRLFKTAPPMSAAAGRKLVADVREVREHAWSVLSAVSRGEAAPTEALGSLMDRAGAGVRARHLSRTDAAFDDWVANWKPAGRFPPRCRCWPCLPCSRSRPTGSGRAASAAGCFSTRHEAGAGGGAA